MLILGFMTPTFKVNCIRKSLSKRFERWKKVMEWYKYYDFYLAEVVTRKLVEYMIGGLIAIF